MAVWIDHTASCSSQNFDRPFQFRCSLCCWTTKNLFWYKVRSLEGLTSNFPATSSIKFCANSSADAVQFAGVCACCWWHDTSLQTHNRCDDVSGIEPGGSVRGNPPSYLTFVANSRKKRPPQRTSYDRQGKEMSLHWSWGTYREVWYSFTVSVRQMHNI